MARPTGLPKTITRAKGTPKTGGRQKGTVNKLTAAFREAMQDVASRLPPTATGLELQQAVYKTESFPIEVRLRAAEAAMPYESPRLAAIQHTGANGGPIQTTHIDLDTLPIEDARAVLRLLKRAQKA